MKKKKNENKSSIFHLKKDFLFNKKSEKKLGD